MKTLMRAAVPSRPPHSQFMLRVRFQARVQHALYHFVAFEEFRQGQGVLLVPFHAHRQRLEPRRISQASHGPGTAPMEF